MTAAKVRVNVQDVRAALNGNQRAVDVLLTACERSERDKAHRDAQARPVANPGRPKRSWKPDPPELGAAKVVVHERSGDMCEAGTPNCEGTATQTHHRAGRGWPGCHHPDLLLAVCGMGNASGCHGWIHADRPRAEALGLLLPRDGAEARSYRNTWPPERVVSGSTGRA